MLFGPGLMDQVQRRAANVLIVLQHPLLHDRAAIAEGDFELVRLDDDLALRLGLDSRRRLIAFRRRRFRRHRRYLRRRGRFGRSFDRLLHGLRHRRRLRLVEVEVAHHGYRG